MERRRSNSDYLIKREQQELEAGLSAADARARQRHLELADAYTSLIDEIKRQDPVTAEISGSVGSNRTLLKH